MFLAVRKKINCLDKDLTFVSLMTAARFLYRSNSCGVFFYELISTQYGIIPFLWTRVSCYVRNGEKSGEAISFPAKRN